MDDFHILSSERSDKGTSRRRPHLGVAVPTVASGADLLQSELADGLSEHFDVTVLTAMADDAGFAQAILDRGWQVRPLPEAGSSARERFGYLMQRLLRFTETRTLVQARRIETLLIEDAALRVAAPVRWLRNKIAGALLASLAGRTRRIWRLSDWLISSRPLPVLEGLLILDVFQPVLRPLLAAVRADGRLKVLGVVRSWDNLSAKGPLPPGIHHLTVWNHHMLREAELFYPGRFGSHNVSVCGALPFDLFFEHERPMKARDQQRLLFALGYPDLYPGYLEHVRAIVDARERGALPEHLHIVVRLQPGARSAGVTAALGEFGREIEVNDPTARPRRSTEWASYAADRLTYRDLLCSSDVVVNHLSTSTLDAAVFDIPSVSIAYDGEVELPYLQSVRRIADRTHYRLLASYHANDIVQSEEALVEAVQRALEFPSEKREERSRAVEGIVGPQPAGHRTSEVARAFFAVGGQ